MDNNNDIRKEVEKGLQAYTANKEHFEMAMKNLAEQMFVLYRAYIEKGFTEQQAFELIKARGLSSGLD